MAVKQNTRKYTLDAALTDTESATLTLEELRAFMEHNDEYNPRVRAVTFEVDDAVSDPS
jgi:hypothetical protein